MRCAPGRIRGKATIFSSASRNCCCSSAAASRKAIRSAMCVRCRPMCRCRRSGCSARAAIAPSSPPRSAWVLPSRIILPITMRRAPCSAIATTSSRRRRMAQPYAILGTAVIAADSDAEAERIATSAESALRAPRQRRISAARLAGRGRRLSLYADRSRTHGAPSRAGWSSAASNASRSGCWRLIEATQCRRIDDHDDGL